MKSSLTTLAASLDLPTLSKADVSSLKSLQRDWDRHSERMNLLLPERVLADQKTAFFAFLAEPTDENEQRLAVLADERLTAKRHGLLHEAHAELRRLTNQKAAGIVRPVLESIQQALQGELEVRETAAQTTGVNKRTDEHCIRLREALDQVAHGLKKLNEVTNIAHVEERAPLNLAAMLLSGDADTPLA